MHLSQENNYGKNILFYFLIVTAAFLFSNSVAQAEVNTNFRNKTTIKKETRSILKPLEINVGVEIKTNDIELSLETQRSKTDSIAEAELFQIVVPVPVDTPMQNNQIEINPFFRYDIYPKFAYHYSGRYSNDYLRMKGSSFGITVAYKYSLKNNLFINAGLGYYNYRFDKLYNENSLAGKTSVRPINFISPLFILYSTDKYHYNNLMARTGIGKEFYLDKETKVITDFNITAYYSISQYYHLSSNPWDGNLNFIKNNTMLFGFSGAISIGIVKQYKNFRIGPSLIVPIFDSWKKDKVFLEGSGSRGKLMNGIGASVVCNIFLPKKNKS